MLSRSISSSLRLMSGANFPPIVAWNVPATFFFNFQGQTSFLTGSVLWSASDELERSSSPSHGHFLYLLKESSLKSLEQVSY